jgi:DNA-binding protein H-NS
VQKRRDMAQELLLEKFEGLASKAKLLEGEKAEGVARIQDLEREIGELKELISLAESKVDEMLEGESAPDVSKEPSTSKAQVTSVPLASKGLEELVGASTESEKKTKRRFTSVF